MRLPSLNTCTDSVTASAEYGAPGVMRDSTAARATSTTCFSSAACALNRLRGYDTLRGRWRREREGGDRHS